MKKSNVFYIPIIFLFALSCLTIPAIAKSDDSVEFTPPEKTGTYDVPGRPNLKVRVFVHNTHDAKPGVPSVTLICPADPDSTSTVPATGWRLPSTFSYTLNTTSLPPTISASNAAQLTNNAFSQWQTVLASKVNLSRSFPDTTVTRAVFDGLNIVAWGRTSGSALAVTYTWYDRASGVVSEVDTIMNQKFSWYWNAADNACTNQNAYDAQDILTHELGHWMGLDDTYTDNYINATMYGYGAKGETKKDTLSTGDISGVTAIY